MKQFPLRSTIPLLLLCINLNSWATDPILEYTFNTPEYRFNEDARPGSGTISTGINPLDLTFQNGWGGNPRGDGQANFTLSTTFYSVDGSGVSGLPGDTAFQFDTREGDMANLDGVGADSQSAAIASMVDPQLSGLDAFTLTGWYKTNGGQPLGNGARLVTNWGAGGSGGFDLRNIDNVPGRLQLSVKNLQVVAPGDPYTAADEWVFFAILYNSLATGEEVRFYIGSKAEASEQVGSALALAAGPLEPGRKFTLGNIPEGGTKSFAGLMDNIRFYGTALSTSEIEMIREGDTMAQVNLPLPPTGLKVQVKSSTEVQLQWSDNSNDEDGFEVIRKKDGVEMRIVLPADTTEFLDSGLSPESTYSYRIESFNEGGSIMTGDGVIVATPISVNALNPIDALQLIDRQPTSVKLGWVDGVVGEAGFSIEAFNEGSRSWNLVQTVPADSENVSIGNLETGTLNRYRVIPFNGDVEGEPTEIVFRMLDRGMNLGGTGAPEIDESLVTRTVHVDVANGDDANDGATLETAKKTINAAFRLAGEYNRAGEGTRILVQPGVYTEGIAEGDLFTQATLEIGTSIFGDPAMPVILEGAGWDGDWANGDVIISGSVRYTDWVDLGDGVYEHEWTIDWPTFHPDSRSPDVLRSYHSINVRPVGEQRWQMYIHMEGPDDATIANLDATDGYFWVNQEEDWIRVKVPEGVDLRDPQLEVHLNERHRLFHFYQPQLTPESLIYTPLVIRNFVFRHGLEGLFLQNGGGMIVEDCRFENNKRGGFFYDSFYPDVTVRRCEFIGNGVSGGGGGLFSNGLWEDLVFEDNARHAWISDYQGWAESGIKFGHVSNSTFRNFVFRRNYGVSLWPDSGMLNFEIYNGIIEEGNRPGIFIENNNRDTIENLGNQITVYVRDVWIRDAIGPRAKGIQFAESENAVVDHIRIEGTLFPFEWAYNVRGPLAQSTIKNSVIKHSADMPMISSIGSITVWREFYDTVIAEFNNNHYFGGSDLPFLDRDRNPLSFDEWVTALNNNPAHLVDGVEMLSRYDPVADNAFSTIAVFAVRPVMSEGDSMDEGLLVTRLGSNFESPLNVELELTTGTGYADLNDFDNFPAEVTIPAGSISIYIPLTASEDGINEGLELLEVQVLAQANYEVLADPARIQLKDLDAQDRPLFIVEALGDRLFENTNEPMQVRILREGLLNEPVSFEWSEMPGAIMNVDYTVEPSSFSFAVDQFEQLVELVPIVDSIAEGPETLSIDLTQLSGQSVALAAPTSLRLPLIDNDGWIPEEVEVDAAGSASKGSFSISNPTSESVEIVLNWPEYTLLSTGSEQPMGPDPNAFIDISATGTLVTWQWWFPNDDGFSSAIELPWNFNWFGEEVSTVFAHSNGFISMGEPTSRNNRYSNPALLPVIGSSTLSNQLAVAWANLKLNASSSLVYERVGDVFVIQWNDFLLNNQLVTFQVQIEEGNRMTVYFQVWPEDEEVMIAYQNDDRTKGGTIIAGRPLPGVPYAMQLEASVPALESVLDQVSLEAGSTAVIDFSIVPSALETGLSRINLPLAINSGSNFDQRLPIWIQYSGDPVSEYFDSGIIDRTEDWLQHDRLGWLFTDSWPYVYSFDLGWLNKPGSSDEDFWYALEWDSGWFYMLPEWYPYIYFYGSDSIPANWCYVLPGDDIIWLFIIGDDWISVPFN